MTFKDLVELYFKSTKLSIQARKSNTVIIEKHFYSVIKNQKLQDLKQIDFARLCIHIMGLDLKPITQKHYICLLGTIINVGRRNQLFKHNIDPFVLPKPKLKKSDLVRKRYMTAEEMQIFLNSAEIKNNENIFIFFLLICYTCARGISVYRIRLKDIDINRHLIRIVNTKSNDNIYTIPLAQEVIKRVIQYAKNNQIKEDEFLFNRQKLKEDDFLLSWLKFYRHVRLKMKKVCIKNNIDSIGLALHAARKGTATLMHESGISISAISYMLDHQETETTNRHYIQKNELKHLKEFERFNLNLDI